MRAGFRGPAFVPKSLSFDLRSRVLAAIDGGFSCRQAAARFGVSAASAIRWQALRRFSGDGRPKRQGGDRRSGRTESTRPDTGFSCEAPDITLIELKARLAEPGAHLSVGALWRFFKRLKVTRKKNRARERTGPARRPEAARRLVRGPARSRSRAPRLHRRNLDLHEHGPTHGRRARGERLRAGVPHGHWKTTTFVAGLRLERPRRALGPRWPDERHALVVYVAQVSVPNSCRATSL